MNVRLTTVWEILRDTVNHFIEDDLFTNAAALAYYTIFSLPPMLLIVTYFATHFYDRETIETRIFNEISKLVGEDGANQLLATMQRVGAFDDTWWSTIVGVGVLVFTATTVFVTIQNTLNRIFRVKPKPKRGWLKMIFNRIISFALLLGIAFILLVSLVISAVISALSDRLANFFPDFAVYVANVASFVLPLVIITLLFGLFFKYLPDVRLRWRDTLAGALFTAILFSVGKYGIGFYVGTSNVGNLYDAAGSLLVILVWVFYASLIFLLGAEFTYVYATRIENGVGVRPASYAVRVVEHEVEIESSSETEEFHRK